jgi:hypothetical protein
MSEQGSVRPSRDGDQFHYLWAARQCLKLLPGATDLVAVTIEGAAKAEVRGADIDDGEELIDVGLYFGAEEDEDAHLVRYIQLKHSTRRSLEPWTASGLKKTIKGFAKRYSKLTERSSADDVAERFRFEFTTNRPIDARVKEALEDLASGRDARHAELNASLLEYTQLGEDMAGQFFRVFSTEGSEGDLWAQRNLLRQDISAYLPEADHDAPVQLKELVTRKATTEFETDPAIRRHDVLRALRVTEEQLQPAICLIPDASNTMPREQEQGILRSLLMAEGPVVIHSDGGVGKSVLAARLGASMPAGSETILYDCFGDGLYRSALNFRHRHRDALVQIANELAARGLCHPLIPAPQADAKQYMRAFIGRLAQAATLIQTAHPGALLCLIVDAADNAEMAAEEQGESASFVRDLIRAALPNGVRLAFTCRTHRRERLHAPPGTQEIALIPFSQSETARHLRISYPSASDAEVSEFAVLSSSNPRVQALAISRGLTLQEMLKQLGPGPTTVERAIGELLDSAIARLRYEAGSVEASQIDLICQALAILRPLVPISTLAQLSQTSESAVRDFALGLGRPLLVKGSSLHFLDEPAETWFRERFSPDAAALTRFTELLRPLASQSSYAAAVLPQLLLQAGKLDELVELALLEEGLPAGSPLERRDVELQRLTFALKACLQKGRYLAAAQLSLKAGGEHAGQERQNTLIQENTDLAAILLAPDRIEEIASRRTFAAGWMGSHHAYEAGLLSGRDEFSALASSHLRMAMEWLRAWARLPESQREHDEVNDVDRAELAMSLLRLRGAEAAANFLRSWTWRRHAFNGGRKLARRLLDIGKYEHLEELAEAAGNDVWLLLGLATEVRDAGHLLPAAPLARVLRLLGDRRVKLPESQEWNSSWSVLCAVRSTVELALRVLPREAEAWADILRRYLPTTPPSQLSSRFDTNRISLLRAYALEAALRGKKFTLADVVPPEGREQLENSNQYGHSGEIETFMREVGAMVPWLTLSADVACGFRPPSLAATIEACLKESSAAANRNYRDDNTFLQTAAHEWFRILRDAGAADGPEAEAFTSWMNAQKAPLWPATLITLCRSAAQASGFESVALDCGAGAYQRLESSRDDAEAQADSYMRLARAILAVSPAEAGIYFNRAVEIASRIGDENLHRWDALLQLAEAAGDGQRPRPRTAYRLSRAAELTYEYVARDKHFDWDGTGEALVNLCAPSSLSILSRWRDRRFGNWRRLLPIVIYRLLEKGQLPVQSPIVLAGMEAWWNRVSDLHSVMVADVDPTTRAVAARIAYRYIRVQPLNGERLSDLPELGESHGIVFSDMNRIIAFSNEHGSVVERDNPLVGSSRWEHDRRNPDWDMIFGGIDLTHGDELRSAYDVMHTCDPPYEITLFFREALTRVKRGREPEVLRAIASWPDLDFFELRCVLEALPSPMPKQEAIRSAVRDAVLAVCRREPGRVRRRGRGMLIPFEKLDRDGLVSDEDVVLATLEGFTAQLDTLGAGQLFQLVALLAARLSPEEADETLNFGLDLIEDLLTPDDGDGPWRPELQPSETVTSSLAGFVWAGLGSPVVAERWQFAHVVRSAVEIGWTDLLRALAAWAESGVAGPFVDQRLEFYVWHARQWLLIGLARGGLENALALRTAMPLLQRLVLEDHVLIRELAAQALRTVVCAGEVGGEEVSDLDAVNRGSLPEEVYTEWRDPVEDETEASDDAPDAGEKYHFGMDIGPYWFAPLARAFGLTQEAIERRARHMVRQRMGWGGKRGWREDARHALKMFDEGEAYHSHGSLPKTDDLLAYHGYHAMMLVAAALLNERPVRRRAEKAIDEFREWLSDHLLTRIDGKWLADRRDPLLVGEPPPPDGYGDKLWCWNVTLDYFNQKLVTDDGFVVLWGNWSGGERDNIETVSVRSAIVSRTGAEALVAALQTAPELDRFVLPSAEEGEDLAIGPLGLWGWVSDDNIWPRLDRGDPWAQSIYYPGPGPSEDVIAKLGLYASSDGRAWTTDTGGLVRSETWTRTQGHGRELETVPECRLSGNNEFLKRLLDGHPECRLLLAVEIRRRPPRSGAGEPEFERYQLPYARYYLLEDDGVAHAL